MTVFHLRLCLCCSSHIIEFYSFLTVHDLNMTNHINDVRKIKNSVEYVFKVELKNKTRADKKYKKNE